MKQDEPSIAFVRKYQDKAPSVATLSSSVRERLMAFAALVTRWNPTIKLVSSHDVEHLWSRHIEDALQLAPLIPKGVDDAIDLGSGGGFPGLVLAITTGMHFDLIESDGRKVAFLREAVALTKARATVHASRIEDAPLKPRMLVTARALAPLPRLLELCHRLLAEGGICLFPKGERADVEIAEASRIWIMDLDRIASWTSATGQTLRIKNLRRRELALS